MPGRGRRPDVSADPPGPELGERFPFLSPFTYRTLGWQWTFERVAGRDPQQARLRSPGHLAGSILERFLADVLECKTSEMLVDLDLVECRLGFLDATPGGSGLAETLLREDRFREAPRRCLQTLQKLFCPIGQG